MPIYRESQTQWGLCALRHGIQILMEAILACHPARSTEWLDCHPKSCELWRIRTGPIIEGDWIEKKKDQVALEQMGENSKGESWWREEIQSQSEF